MTTATLNIGGAEVSLDMREINIIISSLCDSQRKIIGSSEIISKLLPAYKSAERGA